MLEAHERYFRPDMPVAEAMGLHPRVAEVFAAFHLGGCGSCGISQFETIEQVCMAYGVDLAVLLEVLEGLMEQEPAADASANTTDSDAAEA
jgi:hybrid cluster-associated redox disulfide protein